jgi:CIC family chloride channel protein
VGSFFHNTFPNSISSPGAFSLVGMGAVVAGATHAPITAIIIIFELTDDYKIILPLMLSCIIASFITVGIHRDSIYTMKLRRRGIFFKEGREVNILRSLRVKDFNYVGCFALNQLKKLVLQKELLDSLIIAEDIAVPGIQLDYEDDMEKAMQIFGREDVAEIPVLEGKKFKGVVKRKDAIEAYNHEIIKREATSGLVQKLKFTQPNKTYDLSAGYKIMEIEAPSLFLNKSLKELDVKALYRIDVLLIKRKYPPKTITIPSANEVIQEGDVLIIAGLEENITKIFNP